jgi:plastocyanin
MDDASDVRHLEVHMGSLRLALLASLLALAAACNSYSTAEPSPTPSPTPDGPTTAVTIPTNAETLGNRAFAPDEVSVDAGTTIVWTNTDSVAHTTTADGNAWNSGIVSPGGRFSVKFQTAGTFPYHCTIHPGMVGTVVVR